MEADLKKWLTEGLSKQLMLPVDDGVIELANPDLSIIAIKKQQCLVL